MQLNFQNWCMKLKVTRQQVTGQQKLQAHPPPEPLDSQISALSHYVPLHTYLQIAICYSYELILVSQQPGWQCGILLMSKIEHHLQNGNLFCLDCFKKKQKITCTQSSVQREQSHSLKKSRDARLRVLEELQQPPMNAVGRMGFLMTQLFFPHRLPKLFVAIVGRCIIKGRR